MGVGNTGSLLDGPEGDAATGPDLKRCARCGRLGIRQFITYPARQGWAPLTVCTAKTACRKRRPDA